MQSRLVLLCVLAIWCGGRATPLKEKEFFWFPTDKGTVVPAFLKGGPPTASISAVEDDVDFWLYKPGETVPKFVAPDCGACTADFTPGAPVVLLAHGFSSDHLGGFGNSLRDGFATRGEPMNLVFIDWSTLAAAPWYETAANNVRPVGEYVARLVNFLVAQGVVDFSKIYYVGHSLGAHIANFVALNANGGQLEVVHALDPALPLFGVRNDTERIDPADGKFVNVIHTSMGTLADGGLAFEEPRGHIDFYPNSGKNQPGCAGGDFGACSHSRCYYLLAESIGRPGAFPSCKCTSWEQYIGGNCPCQDLVDMGWETSNAKFGIHYLSTNAESPYGQGA